jgi:trehalose 6-phosphate synthase
VSRIVVVSNRIGPIEEGKSAPGGLAVGVFEILRATGGIWFGWSGETVEQTPQAPSLVHQGNITYATIGLSRKDYAEYYAGFSNATLWPLLHYRTGLIDFNRESLSGYLRVNEQFAEHLARLIQPDDIVWVHDYHLIPLGAALRRRGITQRIGFFLHTPLPPRAVLRTLPDHRQIFGTFSAYDVVGFQTADDADHFTDYMVRDLGASKQGSTLALDARLFKAGVFPIGIDPDDFARTAAVAVGQSATRRLARSLGDRPLIIGVDRLDYSKGLPFRFKSIELLLGQHPEWRGRCTFLQVATLSRTDVRQYRDLRAELDAAAGHINGRYADYDWTPIRYVNKSFNRNTLAGFFRHARVGLVTPLRDGMNLVAKEYVAAQKPDDPGVLVLSQFAGAANELDSALLVNPFDVGGVAQAIIRAMEMSLPERTERWRAMMATLHSNTVRDWARRFVETLTANRADMRPAALSGGRTVV